MLTLEEQEERVEVAKGHGRRAALLKPLKWPSGRSGRSVVAERREKLPESVSSECPRQMTVFLQRGNDEERIPTTEEVEEEGVGWGGDGGLSRISVYCSQHLP